MKYYFIISFSSKIARQEFTSFFCKNDCSNPIFLIRSNQSNIMDFLYTAFPFSSFFFSSAHAAVKSDKSPYYKKKYDSLVKRRGKKRAIIAIARMLLTAIYQMLSTGEQWNPSDLFKIDMPEALVEKQKAKAIKQAKKLLQREELFPPDEPLAS